MGLGAALSGCLPQRPRGKRVPRGDDGSLNATTDAAQELVGGRCAALFHVDRLRSWEHGERLSALAPWRALLAGSRVHPLQEVERAFVTAKTYDDTSHFAIVLDLAFDDERRVSRALEDIGTGGPKTCDLPLPAVLTKLDGVAYVVAATGRTLIAVPDGEEAGLKRLVGLAGLPPPVADEALSATARDPHVSLDGTLDWPKTLTDAGAVVSVGNDGVVIDFAATSTSEAQAQHDAETLTKQVRGRLGVDLFLFQLPLVDGVAFASRGREVEMTARFSRTELDVLMTLAQL